jgi:hemoglobin
MPISERRSDHVADAMARTGIDGAMIERLVRTFYVKVRKDAMLGPVFEARIQDWEVHLQRMCLFWSSVALMTGTYNGSPMQKHAPLPVDALHFDRWLHLFELTAHEVCPPAAAEHFIEKARRIAQSLELGIACQNGQILKRGQRYRRLGAPSDGPSELPS